MSCISSSALTSQRFHARAPPPGAAIPWLGSFRCHSHARGSVPIHIMRNIAKGGHRGTCGPDMDAVIRTHNHKQQGGRAGAQRGLAPRLEAREAAAQATAQAAAQAAGVAATRAAAI